MTERKHRLMVGVMVFTLFLWGISNACIAQETDKDNITLSVKDESVEKVLKRLGKETDFNFFYDPSVLNTVSLVTLDVREIKVPPQIRLCRFPSHIHFIIKL